MCASPPCGSSGARAIKCLARIFEPSQPLAQPQLVSLNKSITFFPFSLVSACVHCIYSAVICFDAFPSKDDYSARLHVPVGKVKVH